MATVTNTVKLPDGTVPDRVDVVIELVASTTGKAAGWITASDVTLEATVRPTVTNGAWTASLTPNADITPSGSVYKVTEYVDKTRYVHYISVGSGGGSLFDLLTDAPASVASAALSTHIADTTDAHDASAVSVADADGYYSATNVESALAYLGKRAGAEFHLVDFGTVDTTGAAASDAALAAAMAAVYAGGGGTLVFPPGTIRFDNQIAIPNDGGTSPYPNQPSMLWRGAAAWADGGGGSPPYASPADAGGTIFDLRYTGGGSGLPKIQTLGKGGWEITGITFTDLGTSSNPYLKTTNTTLYVHNCAFAGNPSKSGLTCDQDALILGGTDSAATAGPGPNAPFQGYGTVISQNYFARIRRAAVFGTHANAIVFRDNNMWVSCGNADGGAVELRPGDASIFGNVIEGNLFEVAFYKYGIYVHTGQSNTFAYNNFYDDTATTQAYIRFDTVDARINTVICGYGFTARTHVSEQSAGVNSVINFNYLERSTLLYPWRWLKGIETSALYNGGVGTPEIQLDAQGTTPPAVYAIYSGTPAHAANPGSLTITKTQIPGSFLWVKESGTSTTGWNRVLSSSALWRKRAAKTTSYTFDDDNVVTFDGVGLTATLPSAASKDGRVFTVKNLNASPLTIATTSAQTIDGAAPGTLAQWEKLTVQSDGSNWITL